MAKDETSTRFAGITVDSPWPESGGGQIKRGAQKHYPLIKTKEEILRVILLSGVFRPADDAHLYLWVTNNYLEWGLWLMAALGFKYKTNWPWVKSGRMGLGQYGRGCHELLLFGVKGKGYAVCTVNPPGHEKAGDKVNTVRTDYLVGVPRPLDPKTGKVIHSAKPLESYQLIEDRTVGPYLEMFARTPPRMGWTAWGGDGETTWSSSADSLGVKRHRQEDDDGLTEPATGVVAAAPVAPDWWDGGDDAPTIRAYESQFPVVVGWWDGESA